MTQPKHKGDGPATTAEENIRLEEYIRTVPNFPQKGIQFKDITPLLSHPPAFHQAIRAMSDPLRDARVDVVVAIEARGYILGAPIALELGTGFVPVRKLGKLPWRTYSAEYFLEYGSATLEVHQDGVVRGARVLIVDDVLATGGTLAATAKLVKQSGATVAAMSVLIELLELKGRERLGAYDVRSLITY